MGNFILSAFADEIADDLKTQMDVLENHGIHYIEMRNVNGKCIVNYSLDEVKLIKEELDKKNFKISAIGSPIGKIKITDDFEPHLELFKHTLKVAKILDTKYIRMFSFFIPQGEDSSKYRDEVLRRLKMFIEAAKGSGITLLHENEKEIYGDTAERCLDILLSMNCDYFKAIFDPANFVQCDVKTFPEGFNLLKKYVVYYHIKDAVYSDHHVEPAGLGDGQVRDILKELNDSDFEGFLSIEPHLSGTSLPGGGSEKFDVAFKALDKIVTDITGKSIKL